MESATQATDLFAQGWPLWSVLLVSILLGAAWWAAHHWRGLLPKTRIVLVVAWLLRVAIGTGTCWLVFQLLAQLVVFQTAWSLWWMALLMAAGVETVFSLYQLERQIVTPRVGNLLVGLRVSMVVLVTLILMQPVLSRTEEKTQERFIAVLLDDSASMYLVDKQLTDSEKLQLVAAFSPEEQELPYDLTSLTAELFAVGDSFANEAGAMDALFADAREDDQQQRWAVAVDALSRVVQQGREDINLQLQRIDELQQGSLELDVESEAAITAVADKLREQVGNGVVARTLELESTLKREGNPERLLQEVVGHLKGISDQLRGSVAIARVLIDKVDRGYMASLPEEERKQMDELISQTRAVLARKLLAGEDQQRGGVIDQIAEKYTPRLYLFHSEVSLLDADKWQDSTEEKNGDPEESEGSAGDDENVAEGEGPLYDPKRLVTDLARALEKARKDIPLDQLSGVLVIGDGRHNAAGDVEKAVRQLGGAGVPVSSLVVGSSRPPVDAAVIDVESAPTVLVDDQFVVNARVKLTGMNGRSVRVKLVKDGETIDEQILSVVQEELVQTVRFNDVPAEEGLRIYQVMIEPIQADAVEAEAFNSNNQREVRVSVTDDRTQVLIVEGRPRWEYRYLRTLLAGRDTSVQLQTVLLRPDQLADVVDLPQVHASVSRADEEIEATLLPASQEEWFKFDVVVLGDVSPQMLGAETLEILDRFVNRRGGALIVVAGRFFMPHAFEGTLLADLLPHSFEGSAEPVTPPADEPYQLALTRVGYRHSITQQGESYEENREFWESVPPLYWRHQIIETKPGAVVLAYARTEAAAAEQVEAVENESPEQAEQRQLEQQQYERDNALLTIQKLGAGRVMMLNTDRTWRLRYRTGDRFHHKLWGQVLRWAEAEKLQAGTGLVRLGTNKTVYQAGEALTVTARINDTYTAPVEDENAMVRIYQDDKLVLSELLKQVPDSNGMYRVSINNLSGEGEFRVVLDSPEAKRVLAGEGVDEVETRISLLPVEINSQELNETTIDLVNLARWGSLTGGAVYDAGRIPNVLDTFGSGTLNYKEEIRRTIWDSWILLTLLIVVVTVEWCVRKRGGLV
jgi:hypothetical protein